MPTHARQQLGTNQRTRTVTRSTRPLASITDSLTKPRPSGCQTTSRDWRRGADRRAVDEPGQRQRAALGLEHDRRRRLVDLDLGAIGRKCDLHAAARGTAPSAARRRPVAEAVQRRRQLGAGRAQRRRRAAAAAAARCVAEAREGVEQDRRGGDAAGQARASRRRRGGRPRRRWCGGRRSRRPGVAIAVGGAGLVGDAAGLWR